MRTTGLATLVLVGALGAILVGRAQEAPIRALVVTGGHDFEREPFFAIFDDMPGIEYTEAQHPGAGERYSSEAAEEYDVLVLYDLWQDITEEQKTDLLARIREGTGVVALHHCIASYEAWPEWRKEVLGGHFYIAAQEEDGVEHSPSTYQHDVDVNVHIENPDHPVVEGVEDFVIHDEVYGGYVVSPDVDVLLTTDHPESERIIGWTNTYGDGRIVYIECGHDSKAYANESYRRLIAQAIEWVAEGD